jgi:hypothetical protein
MERDGAILAASLPPGSQHAGQLAGHPVHRWTIVRRRAVPHAANVVRVVSPANFLSVSTLPQTTHGGYEP